MKKNFKKFTGYLLMIAMVLSCFTVPVIADSSILTVDYSLNISDNSLIISGEVVSSKGNIPMVVILSKDGKKLAVDQIVTDVPDDGVVSYEFQPIPFPPTMNSGDYEIYVGAAYLNVSDEVIYTYMGADVQLEFLVALNEKILAEDKAAISGVFAEYAETLDKNSAYFSFADDKSASKFGELIISGGVYEVPEGTAGNPGSYIDTDEKIDTVTESFRALSELYPVAYTIAKAAEVRTKKNCADYIAEYGDIISISTDDDSTDYDEAVMAEYLEEALDFDEIASRMSAEALKTDDYAELKDTILRSGLLTLIENSRYTKIREIVEALPELFTIDTSKYNKYTDAQINKIYQALADEEYDDIEDFIDEHDKIADKGFDKKGGSDGGASGGSGGSVSFDYGTPTGNIVPSTTTVKFNDIANYQWAKEAIEVLSVKGIISGKGDGEFAPATNVTRAEFVKMIVTALNLSATYNDEFSDVNVDDWYAPYVAAAKKAGIVVGDGERFNPNANITREDMAVVLFRAFNMEKSSNERDVFYDSESISDYAKSAVFALYEKGITSGMGNGYFAPTNFATRAESAQMIYNTIK